MLHEARESGRKSVLALSGRILLCDDAGLSRIAELPALFPGEAEYAHMDDADFGQDVTDGWKRQICKQPAGRMRQVSVFATCEPQLAHSTIDV